MILKNELLGFALWIISSLMALVSSIGLFFYPLWSGVWNSLQLGSFLVLGLSLFVLSLFLSEKNKNISPLALISSICSVALFFILLTVNLLISSENIFLNVFVLVFAYTVSLFLIYFGIWTYRSRFEWKQENLALFASIFDFIAAFFLFGENISSIFFYKISFSSIFMIIAMSANTLLFNRIRKKGF